MNNCFDLTNKKILITGASSGIGRTAAIECAKMGAELIINGRNKERLQETSLMIKDVSSVNVQEIICDFSYSSNIKNLVEELPVIDGVVLNAGISKAIPVKFLKEIDINEVLNINTVSQILLFKELLKQKKIVKNASVVFTSSMAGLGENAVGTSLYAASKSAICGFVKGAALEVASKGIRVNTVCPGKVQTEMLSSLESFENIKDDGVKQYPLGRYGTSEDIAKAMIFLLSDASEWITGIDLVIDGGLHLKR